MHKKSIIKKVLLSKTENYQKTVPCGSQNASNSRAKNHNNIDHNQSVNIIPQTNALLISDETFECSISVWSMDDKSTSNTELPDRYVSYVRASAGDIIVTALNISSLSGSYYICGSCGFNDSTINLTIHRIWLEK